MDLADQGLIPYEILQYYFGDDINIVFGAPVQGIERSYPGVPLRQGSAGEDVRILQRQLNRISDNYPAIPKLLVDGFFGVETEAAVREFQRIFNLTPDGIVGKATWYKIKKTYNGVKGLSELYSEGISFDEAQRQFSRAASAGGHRATLYGSPNIIWPSSLILTTRFPKFSSTAISMKTP